MKTKLLKKLRRKANRRYKFISEHQRDEFGEVKPLYKVYDNAYEWECDRLLGKFDKYNEANNCYLENYRKCILSLLDEYYKFHNKTPKKLNKPKFNTPTYMPGDIVIKTPDQYEMAGEQKNGELTFHNKNTYMVMDGENKPIYLRQPNPPVRLENNEKIKIN